MAESQSSNSPVSLQSDGEIRWNRARKYAEGIGSMPNVFAAAVRLLRTEEQSGKSLRPVTKFLVGQAFRGQKILAMLYYAARQFKPASLIGRDHITLGELIGVFEPYDLAVLYGTFLIYRRTLKRSGYNYREARAVAPHLHAEAQVGGLVGAAIPRIGIGNALLAGVVQPLGMSMIAVQDPAGVQEYYQHLQALKQRWDLGWEVSRFGCTSLQVGGALLSKVGFGKSVVETYLGALDPQLGLGDTADGGQNAIRYGKLWIEGLIAEQAQPLKSMPGQFYPLVAERNWLNQQLAAINFDQPAWIERDGSSISETLTPMLFREDEINKPVPQQLRDMFTLKEISDMDDDEFDDLVDQISDDLILRDKVSTEQL